MNRRWVAGALVLAALVAATWCIGSQVSLETVVRQERFLRNSIADHPILSWVVGFSIYLAISLVPGTRGKAVVGGWLFGFWPGLLLVNCALTIAALIGFLLSRHFLGDAVMSRYALRFRQINRALELNGAVYVLLLRVVPISFSLTNYLLGATKLDRKTFWWATQLGLIPGNVVFVNAGAQLPSLHELAEHGWLMIWSKEVLGSIVLLSGFVLLVPIFVKRWVKYRARR
jgi:uncharacterized membrane protein YdjX (TVP38/TMEM64 family)